MIVRRGSNYVSYEVDGLIKKAWLYDLQPLDEAPRIPRKKGQLQVVRNIVIYIQMKIQKVLFMV